MVSSSKRPKKLGLAFPDMLVKNKVRYKIGNQGEEEDFSSFWDFLIFRKRITSSHQKYDSSRIGIFLAISAIFMAVIFGRLFFLQIVKGEENRQRSEVNRIFIHLLHAPRGQIYDKQGQVLAKSTAAFRLIKGEDVQIINKDTALALEAEKLAFEGVKEGELGRLEVDAIRDYPFGEAFSHVLGYVSQISADELKDENYKSYQSGDRVGRLGIEAVYESNLKGRDGKELIETDAKGNRIRLLGEEAPRSGLNLHLTVDASLQKTAYDALSKMSLSKNAKGAVVIQDPKTGAVLALASFPSFDNNIFTSSSLNEQYQRIVDDKRLPFFNRATLGVYPPGSVFKIVSSLAGLESGKINKDTQIEDVGEIFLGTFRFANWYFESYGKKEGVLDLIRAIARSNDIFFYRIGQYVGEKTLADMAFKLGLGKKTGLDFPSEEQGLIPTPEWKKEAKNEPWLPGNTLHMAIGQGDVLTTPLQISNMTTYVASNGILFKPYLVSQITDNDGNIVKKIQPKVIEKDLVKQENLNLVKEGMRQACETGGTAWPFFDFTVKKISGEAVRIPVGCKTGTAEFGIEHPHAWFTAFAPFDNPEIVVTVIVEEAGEGSSVAAPVAKDVLNWYFANK